MNKKFDMAGVLTIASLVLMALGSIVEMQQRKQDNHEIAAEVAALLKEEK